MRLAFGTEWRSTGRMGLFEPDAPSDRLERFARTALVLADRAVGPYTSRFSRRDFTQPQLLAVLLLRGVMDQTYRGVYLLLKSSDTLRHALGLRKVPHWTTLERTANTPGTRELLDAVMAELMASLGGGQRPEVGDVAIDSTGLETSVASAYFTKRAGKTTMFVKVSLAAVCAWMLPCALVTSMGASNDNLQAPELVRKLARVVKARVLYADAGYDGEPLHRLCREELGIESWIKPVPKTRDGTIRTQYRAMMSPMPRGYARRVHVESVISAIKRTTGSRLRARAPEALRTEAAVKIVAYAVW